MTTRLALNLAGSVDLPRILARRLPDDAAETIKGNWQESSEWINGLRQNGGMIDQVVRTASD
jgi:hypothetical protein